jgi:hypothetical protein
MPPARPFCFSLPKGSGFFSHTTASASLEGLWPTRSTPGPAKGERCKTTAVSWQPAGHLETKQATSGCQEPQSRPLFITSISPKLPQECILLPVRVAGSAAIALVDTGASATFMSQEFAQASGIAANPDDSREAVLAEGTTVAIQGRTPDLRVQLTDHRSQRKHQSKVSFHLIPKLDGMDLILGMDWLKAHDARVHAKTMTVSIPGPQGPLVLRARRSAPAIPSHEGPYLDVISTNQLVRSLRLKRKQDSCTTFLGYIKELLISPDDTNKSSSTQEHQQPTEYAAHEEAIAKEFSDVIREELPSGLPPERKLRDGRPLEHAIPLKPNSKPVSKQPYKLSPDELEAVRQELTKATNQGFIRPSLSPWGAPVVFQQKKNGKLRMCIDYRALNQQTVKHAYPMPRIEELLDKLRGYKVISKVDLADGFNQIRMKKEDIEKTTFVTQNGAFEFLVMPFGLANAPAMFTLMMQEVLQGLPNVVVFMDDILIFSETLEEHHKHLRAVLSRLRDHNLYAKPSKCELYRTHSEYLGHVATPKGIQPVAAKVTAVAKWPIPGNTKELRQFLGLTGFYRHPHSRAPNRLTWLYPLALGAPAAIRFRRPPHSPCLCTNSCLP